MDSVATTDANIIQGRYIQRHLMGILGYKYLEEDPPLPEKAEDAEHPFKRAFTPITQNPLGPLKIRSAGCSSCDGPEQSIENTTNDSFQFWSTTGISSRKTNPAKTHDSVLYRLPSPVCFIAGIGFRFARIYTQPGQPLYPSRKVKAQVLSSPFDVLHQTKYQQCAVNEQKQWIHFKLSTPPGGYIRLIFKGRMQKQPDDDMYYLCLRDVAAEGIDVGDMGLDTMEKDKGFVGIGIGRAKGRYKTMYSPMSYVAICNSARHEFSEYNQASARTNQRGGYTPTRHPTLHTVQHDQHYAF